MEFAKVYQRGREAFDQLLVSGTLRAKATRGAMFLSGGSIAEQASRFARNMLLTRLLAPGAFGAMAIVMSSAAIVGALTEVGLRAAIVQNPRGGEKAYLDAGWWIAMGRSISVYAIIFAMAPWVAHFYGNLELSALLRVTLLGTLFDGAMSPRSILLQKEMRFGRWLAISNIGAICGVALTVILSFTLRSVWALAIGYCSENVFRCLLSYILCPGLPSFGWDRHAVRDLYKYSRATFGLSFLNLIFSRADIFVLGKLYSSTSLGLYTMSVSLVQTPSVFLTAMLAQTLFPAFAHVQHDKERVNRILVEVTSWIILLGLPVVVAIYLCGHSLLSVIFGARYVAGTGPLALAAVVVFLNTLNVAITCVFSGIGHPELHRRAVSASAIVMMILIYPACRLLGLVGGQVAALVAVSVSYLIQILRMRGLSCLDLLRYGRAFVPALLVSVGVLGVGIGAHSFGLATRPLANIAFSAGACVTAYALCVPAFLRIRQNRVDA
ncbi:MAG: oligosaccharide flippase family protein [Candidatus Acidiferrum sp.]